MWRVLLTVLLFCQAQAQEFNYGLWGKREVPRERPGVEVGKKEPEQRETNPARRNQSFTWQDFLPKNLPRPFLKLLENPTPENARKYWKAYEEFVSRVAEAERQVRLLQLEFARRVSSRYRLYYFFSPSCPACRSYSPILFSELLKEGFNVPVKAFVVGDLREGRVFAAALGIADVKTATPELLSQLEVSTLPTAVLLEGDRVVAKYSGSSVLELLTFLKEKRDEAIGSDSGVSSDR